MKYPYIQPPFSLKSMDRATFTSEAEIAAIFCLAEERRKKKGLLGGTEENFAFLLKTNYPIYAIRWRDRCILLDGLGSIFDYVIYQDMMDAEKFLNDLSKASEEVGLLRAFLTKNAKTFRSFKSSRRMKLSNIISNVMLLSELTDFIKKSSSATAPKETSVCFRVDEQTVEQIHSEFDTLVKQVEQDIDSLVKMEKALRSSIDKAKRMIRKDKEKEFEERNRELDRLKPLVDKKIEELSRMRDEDLHNLTRSIEQESEDIRKEKLRCERDVDRLTLIQAECLEEKKSSSHRGDRIGEDYWSKQLEQKKAEIKDLWKNIRICTERLEKIQFKSDAKVKRLKDKYDKQVREAEEEFKRQELSRDSAAEIKDLIMEELEHRYSLISAQISRLSEAKRKERSRLLDMTTSWTPKEDSVVLVPLYLTKYENEGRERYDIYAPAMAKSYVDFKKTFRRAFLGLESKITRLLTSIGREFEEFCAEGFLKLLTSNRKFEEAILQDSSRRNLFENPDRGRIFRTGLDFLKSEGWLTEEEYKRMLQALNLAFKTASKTEVTLEDQALR